jgi:hypothetical protein
MKINEAELVNLLCYGMTASSSFTCELSDQNHQLAPKKTPQKESVRGRQITAKLIGRQFAITTS